MSTNKDTNPHSRDADDSEGSWQSFLKEHQELAGIDSSQEARDFERSARRRERQEMRSRKRRKTSRHRLPHAPHARQERFLEPDGTTDGAEMNSPEPGPRDFERSILDMDSELERGDGHFLPPRDFDDRTLRLTRIVLLAMCLLGTLGVICSLVLPSFPRILAVLCAVLLIVGLAGSIGLHRPR